MEVIAGQVPSWISGSGDGYGSGYGYGYGDGSGSGSGYGDGVIKCAPLAITLTAGHLKAADACLEGRREFDRLFPNGAEWPRDYEKARDAGLDIEWARKNLGLLIPK
jgi:hypothetical protein